MIKVVVVDDEQHCTDMLVDILEDIEFECEILKIFNSSREALAYIQTEPDFDILFLDIEMSHLDGFALLDQLDKINFDVIFTTAYDQYAIRAFKYTAFNYLLKPIMERDLAKVVNRWKNKRQEIREKQWKLLKENMKAETQGKEKKLVLPSMKDYIIIEISQLVRCQSDSNYTEFYCRKK